MAPSDEAASHGQASDSTTNPFISFRRFADEQMSNLFSGILHLSSNSGRPSSSPNQALADYQAWLEEARRSLEFLESEETEGDRTTHTYTAANRDAAREEITEAIQELHKPSRCPYRPADQPVSKPETDLVEPSLAALGLHLPPTILAAPVLGIQRPSVPIAYLLYSPYSPIQLEQHGALNNPGVRWREAFEDLLAVQNGEKLDSTRAQSNSVPSLDWVKGMIGLAMCKRDQDRDEEDSDFNSHNFGSLPGRTVRFRTTREFEDDEADRYQAEEDCPQCACAEDLDTEMDLYSLFLGAQGMSLNEELPSNEASSDPQPESRSKPFSHPQHDFNLTETDGKKPSILSTLTTTERSTLPDGTTHTKVVLKKRFSDGREESTETMSTQNPPPKPQYQPPIQASSDQGTQRSASEASSTEKKSSGWFWS